MKINKFINLPINLALCCAAMSLPASGYTPSEAVIESQRQFSDDRFGIFIHWGIYSMFGQGRSEEHTSELQSQR